MEHPPITVYTQPTCQACHRLKNFLAQKGVEYRQLDITADEEAFAQLQHLGFTTTPVILIGSEVIVGFDQPKLEQLLFDKKPLNPTA
ncbi:MAG: glutaredoxin family protein [Chloroflexota bacterium]